jgi:hypothetical protein
MTSTKTLATAAALGGILQFALGLTAYQIDAATVLPDLGQPARLQAAHLAAHPAGGLFWTTVTLETAGLVLFLAFAAYLAHRLREAGAPTWLTATAQAVATTAIAVKLASLAPALTAIQHPHAYGDTTTAALLQVNGYGDQVMLALQGSFYLAVAAATLTVRARRWLGWIALVGGVATVAAGFGFDSGQLGGIAVTLAAAAWLLRRPSVALPAPAPAEA